jgi:hypothetical protein
MMMTGPTAMTPSLKAGILLCALMTTLTSGQVRRGRNEGTFNIPASNVAGGGNIFVAALFAGSVSSSGIRLDPGASLNVGIADILQLSGNTSFTNFRTLGTTEGHFQLTLPGNDHLRFFGAAASGDLFLSTKMDTLSGAAISGRPDYRAYIRPSIIIDLDWIAKIKALPLKTYAMFSMADNPDLLYLYSQLSFRVGAEIKLNKNSYAIDFGTGLYKELRKPETAYTGDKTYRQQRFWIEPAVRYRLFDRFSILGAVRILLLQRVKSDRPIEPTYLRISLGISAPLLFKETNSEAIRSMIFLEKSKQQQPNAIDASINKGTTLESTSGFDIKKLDLPDEEEESEKEVMQRRKEIQQKMEEIEQMLEDLE